MHGEIDFAVQQSSFERADKHPFVAELANRLVLIEVTLALDHPDHEHNIWVAIPEGGGNQLRLTDGERAPPGTD